MEHEKHEQSPNANAPTEPSPAGSDVLKDEPACRCKEAQGKGITDFIKVMLDDLAFWRKKH